MPGNKSDDKEKAVPKKKGSGDDSGFSVILGTRRIQAEEEEEKPEKPEEHPAEKKPKEKPTKKPAPQKKPAAVKKPAEKKLTTAELMKKRQELELFLDSLEEAHTQSKFPVYTYERLKRKNEMELGRIDAMLKEARQSAPAGGATPPRPSGEPAAAPAGKGTKTESVPGKLPSLKSQLASLRGKMDEYESLVSKMRSGERPASAAPKSKAPSPAPGPGKKISVDTAVKGLDTKVDIIASKLEETFEALRARIEQLSVIGEVETAGYVKELKREMEKLRAELPSYMKKDDLRKIVLQPVTEEKAAAPKAKAPSPPKAVVKKPETTCLCDLEDSMGKDVTVECDISPLKSIDEKGMRLFWYRIQDRTGESVLTAYEEIKAKRAKIRGSVKKTRTGSVYIFYKKMV